MPKNITLVLSGYYGFDNAGDEAILLSILQKLKSHEITPVVLSGNPDKTASTYGVKAVDRMNIVQVMKAIKESDGLISGGGSLLQDTKSPLSIIYYLGTMNIAHTFNKPVFFYSQGVGPVARKWLHPFIRMTLKRSALTSVRDNDSLDFLQKIKLHSVELSVDPVLGLRHDGSASYSTSIRSFLDRQPVVVSIRPWGDDSRVIDKTIEMIEGLVKKQIPVLLLPFHQPHDVVVSQQVKEYFNDTDLVQVATENLGVQDFISIIKRSRLLIGMRLHSLIFAASQHVPFVGISYDPKIDAFMELYGKQASTDTTYWNVDSILTDAERILGNRAVATEEIKEITNELRHRVELPLNRIIEHFNVQTIEEESYD